MSTTPSDIPSMQQEIETLKKEKRSLQEVINYLFNGNDLPVNRAAAENNTYMLKLLLKQGAPVNKKYSNGSTALHIAAAKGYTECMDILLLEEATNIEERNNKGHTALHMAVLQNHHKCVKSLVYAGGDVNAKDNDGCTALDIATKKGYQECLNALRWRVKYNVSSILCVAASEDDIRWVKILLARGVNVNEKDANSCTALYTAANEGHRDLVIFLLEKGAEVNAKHNLRGYTPLHCAAEKGYIEIVKILLEKGADVNAKNTENYTPLHVAALQGHIDIVKILLEKGADVNAKDTEDSTPLHFAAQAGNMDIIEILLGKGADANVINSSGKRALEVSNGNGFTPMHLAIQKNDIGLLELLLDKGGIRAVYSYDKDFDTSVHWAARNDNPICLRMLLDKIPGAVGVINTHNHNTPLHLAAQYGRIECVKILLERGADKDRRNKVGHTALELAVSQAHNDCVEILTAWTGVQRNLQTSTIQATAAATSSSASSNASSSLNPILTRKRGMPHPATGRNLRPRLRSSEFFSAGSNEIPDVMVTESNPLADLNAGIMTLANAAIPEGASAVKEEPSSPTIPRKI